MSDVVQVLCRPLTRFEGRASCEVAYSTIPNTVNMGSVGGARDIITVLLMSTAGPEVTLTVAAATRGGYQDVVVEGTFETMAKHMFALFESLCREYRKLFWESSVCVFPFLLQKYIYYDNIHA